MKKMPKVFVSALAIALVISFAIVAYAAPPNITNEWRNRFQQRKRGDNNNYGTAAVQLVLHRLNYGIDVDRNFGPATETKVKAYQKNAGLTQDGIVGPNTWGNMQFAWLSWVYEKDGYDYYRINEVAGYTFRRSKATTLWYVAYPVNADSWYYIPLK